MSEIEPRTGAAKNRPTPPTEYLSDGRERRWCNGRKTDGTQCRKAPIQGGTVCSKHGGRAPHIKRAAKARLENAADRLARQLLAMAEDDSVKPETRLAALKDALDRAGLGARQAVDIAHELKPYQRIFEGIDRDAGDAPRVVQGVIVRDDAVEFDDGREA